MIAAAKSRWFRAWFASHARSRIAQRFSALRVHGLERALEVVRGRAAIVAANHTAWWDPLLALVLTERLGVDAYAMMDARNLERLPFFRKIGAFGVDLSDPRDGARAILYAARLLRRPGALVWIFPQGQERPATQRPLGFRGGSAELARAAKGALVLPVALRYEHRGAERPEILVAFGEPVDAGGDVEVMRAAQEAAVVGQLERIDAALIDGSVDAWPALVRAPESRVGRWMERLLALLTR